MLTPEYRLFALAVRMSLPGPGVLLVTIGSPLRSKNIGCRRASIASSDSPCRVAKVARDCADALTAAANASGVVLSTNLRAVRLLYGPLLIQNSLVYRSISASVAASTPCGC